MASTTPSAIAAYAKSSAATASPQEIVRMAYERIITACDRSANAAATEASGWRQVFHDETVRAQSILLELSSVLQVNHADPEVSEMSAQLASLYRFVIDQLVRANVEKNAKHLGPARSTIDGLRDAWVTSVLER